MDAYPNPMGTDGFEFVEYTAPDPAELRTLFGKMGFPAVARHRSRNVTLHRHGGINFIINAEPDSFAAQFVTAARSAPWRFVSRMRPSPTSARWIWARGRDPPPPGRWSSISPASTASATA
jgi:4-hydroxyphenylpyruvate dioxygenase